MERIQIRNYVATTQRVYRKDMAEYALLSVEATSPEDAREAVQKWCDTMNRQSLQQENTIEMPPYEIAPGSLQEIRRLSHEPGEHTAWADPQDARYAVITLLTSGLTEYPRTD